MKPAPPLSSMTLGAYGFEAQRMGEFERGDAIGGGRDAATVNDGGRRENDWQDGAGLLSGGHAIDRVGSSQAMAETSEES